MALGTVFDPEGDCSRVVPDDLGPPREHVPSQLAGLARISYHTDWLGAIVKGHPVKLIEDGEVQQDAMRGSSLSRRDVEEAIRQEGMRPDPSRVALAYLERDGSISVIPRERSPRVVEIRVADGVQTARIELS